MALISSLRPLCAAGTLLALAACATAVNHAAVVPLAPAAASPTSEDNDASDDPGFDARAKIRVNKKTLAFLGALAPGTISASERGYTGVLRAKSANVKVARVKPRRVKHGAGDFTIEPTGGGTTTITISDNKGNSAKVTVRVTATIITLQSVPAMATSVTFTTQIEPGTGFTAANVPLGGSAKNCKTVSGKRTCSIVVTPTFPTKKPKGTHTNAVLMNLLDSSNAIVANARFFASVTAHENTAATVPILTFSAFLPVAGNPYTLSSGSDGRIWYVDPVNAKVGAVTTAGAATTYAQPALGLSSNQSTSIVAGTDGKLWLTAYGSDFSTGLENAYVDSLSTTGAFTPYGVTKPVTGCSVYNYNQPRSIANGPDGNLWYTEQIPRPDCATVISGVGVMSRAGAVLHDFPLPTDSAGQPIYTISPQQHGIVAGPDGALYFWAAECTLSGNTCTGTATTAAIGRMTTAGALSFTPVAGITNCSIGYLARGGDGNVWFGAGCVPAGAQNAYTTIGRVTSSGITLFYGQNVQAMDFPLLDLDEGPDGNLYMPAQGQFGRFVTTGPNVGQIDEYGTPINQGGHYLNSMVTGSDHNLYASDCGACAGRGGSYLERIALP
jgi:streptogramin lyase